MSLVEHNKKIAQIISQIKNYQRLGHTKRIRFTHGSTNSTRVQDKSDFHLIDISQFDQIIEIDEKKKIAIVEPNVPMDILVAACLEKGVIPKVVMEFPGITCGGGVNGAALEASSFKYGQFNDTCTEYELILANGEHVIANTKKNKDLFYGISGSYGTLALLTRISLQLIPAKQYVKVTFSPTATSSIVEAINQRMKNKVDYLEGIIFDQNDALLITGELTNESNLQQKTFSRATDEWFFLFAKKQLKNASLISIIVPIKDYLFRYDRGAFWMGEHAFAAYHMPFSSIVKYILNPFMNTRTMYKGLHETNLAQNFFIQDFYLPLSQTNTFLAVCMQELAIYPLWLCPIKSTNTPQKLSPHYLKEKVLIDVGIWGKPKDRFKSLEKINREFEDYLKKFGGRKMFYADSFYIEQEFWKIYDKKWYMALREKYKANGMFPTIWQKIQTKKQYPIKKWKILKTIYKTMFL